jgi:hypothetical protein
LEKIAANLFERRLAFLVSPVVCEFFIRMGLSTKRDMYLVTYTGLSYLHSG